MLIGNGSGAKGHATRPPTARPRNFADRKVGDVTTEKTERSYIPVADPADRPRKLRETVRVIVIDQDRTLLFEDSDPGVPGAHWWVTPGGGVDPGESEAQAAIREVFEETGYRISKPEPFGIASDPAKETATFPNGDVTQSVAVLFHARKPKTQGKFDPGETLEIGWFAPCELPKDTMPNSLRTLKAYWRFQKTGKFQMI